MFLCSEAVVRPHLSQPGECDLRIFGECQIRGHLWTFPFRPSEEPHSIEGAVRVAQLGDGLRPWRLGDHRPDLISADEFLAGFATAHRVAESLLVARRLPDRAVHDDRAVHALHVVALADIPAPPEILQVFLQFHAERTEVPESIEATVDFRGLENEATPLAEARDFFHAGCGSVLGHKARNQIPERLRSQRALFSRGIDRPVVR
jgi:hypothetical protein